MSDNIHTKYTVADWTRIFVQFLCKLSQAWSDFFFFLGLATGCFPLGITLGQHSPVKSRMLGSYHRLSSFRRAIKPIERKLKIVSRTPVVMTTANEICFHSFCSWILNKNKLVYRMRKCIFKLFVLFFFCCYDGERHKNLVVLKRNI